MAHFVLAILKEYVKMRQILEVIENEINLLFLQKKTQNKATTMRKKRGSFKEDLYQENMLQADSWKL